jgi:hypothetical protein
MRITKAEIVQLVEETMYGMGMSKKPRSVALKPGEIEFDPESNEFISKTGERVPIDPAKKTPSIQELKGIIQKLIKEVLQEVSPPGFHGTVRAMKTKHPEKFGPKAGTKNPYALAWAMKNKGFEPHYKEQETSMKGKPELKKKFKKDEE